MREARCGHITVIATDWRRLADFYGRIFGRELVPPERDDGVLEGPCPVC